MKALNQDIRIWMILAIGLVVVFWAVGVGAKDKVEIKISSDSKLNITMDTSKWHITHKWVWKGTKDINAVLIQENSDKSFCFFAGLDANDIDTNKIELSRLKSLYEKQDGLKYYDQHTVMVGDVNFTLGGGSFEQQNGNTNYFLIAESDKENTTALVNCYGLNRINWYDVANEFSIHVVQALE